MSQTFLYARVSTAEQTVEHQATQARAAGFSLDEVIQDAGVSGVNTLFVDRPGGRRVLDKLRKGDVLVVRWLDRLGRNYADVTETVRALLKRGVTVKTVINGLTFDGAAKDPMQMAVQDALLGFMSAMGQAQAEATKEAQRAGIAHAKAKEGESAYRGRKPSYDRAQLDAVTAMLDSGVETVSSIAKTSGLTRQTIYRIKGDRAEAEAALAAWGA